MKIILNGVETNNKGAELMLYAILQEIERKYPDSKVYVPASVFKHGYEYIHTTLNVYSLPIGWIIYNLKLPKLFKRLHLSTKLLQDIYLINGADYFIDCSGFHFSDQKANLTPNMVWKWKHMLSRLYKQGCRIVFLPQAFGPAKKKNTLNGLKIISNYSSLIIPRERTSYNSLEQSGVVDMKKVKLFSDFTSLVEGIFPKDYERLKGGICIIPNLRMIDTGTISKDKYINLLAAIANKCKDSGRPIYLLNHEGKRDEQLAHECKQRIGNGIEVVTGLNALEVKGMIASAYVVVTSRFHGLASALNSCVPCLATSWSHKYAELYNDYELSDCVLPLDNNKEAEEKVLSFMDKNRNDEIRQHLSAQIEKIKAQTMNMWNVVWSL